MFKAGLLTFILAWSAGFFLPAIGQDQIITVSGDTLQGKIHRISNRFIHFTQSTGGVQTRSEIRRTDVISWQVHEKHRTEPEATEGTFQHEKWRFSMAGGGGYRIASTKGARTSLQEQGFAESEIDSYFRQIKTEVKASGQVHYMFWDNYGLGVDYQFHHASGSLYGTVDPGDGFTLINGEFNDDIYTNYVGVSLYMEQYLHSRIKFFGQISAGLTLFREETVIVYNPLLITGKAYGGNTELGLEYFIGKKAAFSLSAGLFQSTISRVDVSNGGGTQEVRLQKEQREGLSRIDLSAGLVFYL